MKQAHRRRRRPDSRRVAPSASMTLRWRASPQSTCSPSATAPSPTSAATSSASSTSTCRPTAEGRLRACASRRSGITADPALFQPPTSHRGRVPAAKQLLGSPRNRPTAIFAASDEMAIGAILAARDLGLSVPNDLSVIGIDDHELRRLLRAHDHRAVPVAAGTEGGGDPHGRARTRSGPTWNPLNTPLPFELIVRSSTARANRR